MLHTCLHQQTADIPGKGNGIQTIPESFAPADIPFFSLPMGVSAESGFRSRGIDYKTRRKCFLSAMARPHFTEEIEELTLAQIEGTRI